jgi:hypothetical protein
LGGDDHCHLIARPYLAVIQRSAFRDEGSLFDPKPPNQHCAVYASVFVVISTEARPPLRDDEGSLFDFRHANQQPAP